LLGIKNIHDGLAFCFQLFDVVAHVVDG
jgi:hypothetical protein